MSTTASTNGKPPASGWFWMSNAVVSQVSEIGPAALAVYVVLASHANASRQCWPRVERIAALTGFSNRHVKRAIHTLCQAGLLTVTRKSEGPTSGSFNVYALEHGDTGVTLKTEHGDTGVRTRGHGCPNKGTSVSLFDGLDNILEEDLKNKTQEQERVSAGADNPLTLERQLIAAWNALDGVKHNRGETLTDSRRKRFRTRLKSPTWFQDALEAMAKFPLKCQLDAAGKVFADAWRPNIEWLLKPDSVTKILEGKYDWSKSNGHANSLTPGPGQRHEADTGRGRGVL